MTCATRANVHKSVPNPDACAPASRTCSRCFFWVSWSGRRARMADVARGMGVRASVHLKIDTGMERIGVHYYSADTLLEASLQYENVEIEGIFSHFASADAVDKFTVPWISSTII